MIRRGNTNDLLQELQEREESENKEAKIQLFSRKNIVPLAILCAEVGFLLLWLVPYSFVVKVSWGELWPILTFVFQFSVSLRASQLKFSNRMANVCTLFTNRNVCVASKKLCISCRVTTASTAYQRSMRIRTCFFLLQLFNTIDPAKNGVWFVQFPSWIVAICYYTLSSTLHTRLTIIIRKQSLNRSFFHGWCCTILSGLSAHLASLRPSPQTGLCSDSMPSTKTTSGFFSPCLRGRCQLATCDAWVQWPGDIGW